MWSECVRQQRQALESVASWASQVNLGRARDLIREASYELKKEEERAEEIEKENLAKSGK